MRLAQFIFGVLVVDLFTWHADWALAVPLIVLTVVIHVVGLGLVSQKAVAIAITMIKRRNPKAAFMLVTGATTLLATCLHALEVGIWAAAYWIIDAFPDFRSSMLYSLNAITSYGHTTLTLQDQWQLMGALEALNGWLLFGLTTAFLFAVIGKVWSLGSREVDTQSVRRV